MAVLGGSERSVKIVYKGEDVTFYLREGTNEETSGFLKARYPVKRNKSVDNSIQARVDFFDRLFLRVENLEKPGGEPITRDDLALIPINMKASIIFEICESFEVSEEEAEKN